MTTTMRLPKGLRYGHDDSLACEHRDLSVCPACAARYAPACVNIYGHHYWIPDATERDALSVQMLVARVEGDRP
jgi:hypothetical protein